MGGPSYIWFEGHKLDPRTRDMIVALRVICVAPVEITQGSYNTGVSASAGTHDGGGAVDIRAVGRTDAERAEIVLKARHVGFAAWLRHPDEGNWPYHVHCIAIGCPDLSAGAANQVVDYHERRNGLANNRADDGPRTYVDWTWEKYKKTYPDLLTEDTLTAQDVTQIRNDIADLKKYVEARDQAYAAFLAKNLTQQLTSLLGNVETLDQKYAVAVNNYVKQLDVENDADAAALKAQVVALTGKVDALPKAAA